MVPEIITNDYCLSKFKTTNNFRSLIQIKQQYLETKQKGHFIQHGGLARKWQAFEVKSERDHALYC